MTEHEDQEEKEDLVWGAKEIAKVLGTSERKVYTLHATGHLEGAVKVLGRRTLVGSRKRLKALFFDD